MVFSLLIEQKAQEGDATMLIVLQKPGPNQISTT